jgi:hypothetical protein
MNVAERSAYNEGGDERPDASEPSHVGRMAAAQRDAVTSVG